MRKDNLLIQDKNHSTGGELIYCFHKTYQAELKITEESQDFAEER